MDWSDPNHGLSDEEIGTALWLASGAFRRVHMNPMLPPRNPYGCKSLLYGELGRHKFLAYVRATQGEEIGEGTGSMPAVLVDTALILGAEPHVIRIHTLTIGEGVGVRYFGDKEFVRHVKGLGQVWLDALLQPRKFADYVRWTRGHLSILRIDLLESTEVKEGNTTLELTIDGDLPYKGTFCPLALLGSTHRSDEHWIFTCWCGEPGCARVDRGVIVAHSGDYTLWKAYHARKRRIFLFDRDQYRQEILRMGRILVKEYRQQGIECIPWDGRMDYLEKAYYEATE